MLLLWTTYGLTFLWTGVSRPGAVRRKWRQVGRQYKVTLESEEGQVTFDCPEDSYLLGHAEEEGIEMTSFCRYGNCAACIGKVLSGSVDQSEQMFLSEEELEQGYIVTCVGYPTSDVIIRTGCRDEVIEEKCCFSTPLCDWCPYQGVEGDRPKKRGQPGLGWETTATRCEKRDDGSGFKDTCVSIQLLMDDIHQLLPLHGGFWIIIEFWEDSHRPTNTVSVGVELPTRAWTLPNSVSCSCVCEKVLQELQSSEYFGTTWRMPRIITGFHNPRSRKPYRVSHGPRKNSPVSNSTRWGSVTLRIMLGHVNWNCGGPRISKKQGYFMIFHDMSVYFMICQYISWFLWFHGISWLLKGGVAATEPSGYVPGLQRFRCRRSPGHVGHGGTPNHPKVDRSGIESHGDLGILLKRNLHVQHPKVHPESRPGAPIGPQGVVGAIFLVPTRIY